MKKLAYILSLAFLLSSLASLANEGPCQQIKEACKKAGFIQGHAKEGKGLWVDCINPLMQGTVAKKSILSLPPVDPAVITQCKQKHPKFGSGNVAN